MVTVLNTPTNGSNDQMLNTNLVWDAMANASSYIIEIATTPGFGNDVVETASVSNNMYTTMNLQPLTVYYWRVRGVNNCGEGDVTSWYSFQTAGTGCTTYTSTDTPITISTSEAATINSFLTIGDNFTMGYEDAAIASDFILCNNIIGYHYDTFPPIEIDHDKAVNYFKSKGKRLTLPKTGETIGF